MQRRYLIVALLALGTSTFSGAGHSEPTVKAMQAPGSKVQMDLAPQFEAAERFVGFVDDTRDISIVTSDMPAVAYDQMSTGMTPEAMTAKGFKGARTEKLDRPDPYIHLRAVQAAPDGLDHEKFILIFKDAEATSLVSINVPKVRFDKGEVSAAEIASILASARRATADIAPLKPVATIADPAPLKLALSYGLTQLWTLDGKSGQEGASSPAIIIAGSFNREPVSNMTKLSADGLTGLAGYTDVRLGKTEKLIVDGSPAIEGTAIGRDSKSGEERALYQVIVAPENASYVRFIGIAPKKDQDEWFVLFRRAVKSMKLVE